MGVDKKLLIALLAEFLASFIVQFMGCFAYNGIGVSNAVGNFLHGWTGIVFTWFDLSFSWGFAVLAATQIFRIISGAHINPCISIAAMIVKETKIVHGLLYILMHLIGTLLGYGLALGLKVKVVDTTGYCMTLISDLYPWWKALIFEFCVTGAWVFAMCASWHPSNEEVLESISLRIGLVVFVCHVVAFPYTGCSMNPFRSLWPAIVSNKYDYIYVPLLVPPITAALLALAWRFIYVGGTEPASEEKDK